MKMYKALAKWGEVRYKDGDIGIEVEMEGRRLPLNLIPGWLTKPEGSLRGEGIEYVLAEPCAEEAVAPLLEILWSTFARNKSILSPSSRCSVHVHINVQRMTEVQLFNFITLYLIVEDALVNWCGDGRVGNLFCLRARDAEFVIDSLEETSVDGLWGRLHTNDLRYAALNCKALGDFGSLEFRSLRGTDDPELIKKWVSILLHLRNAALRYDFPNNILDGFSAGGEEAFCREVFGDHFEELFDYPTWREDVRSGMRRCQCIAYSGDWLALSNNEPVKKPKFDPGEPALNRNVNADVNLGVGVIQPGGLDVRDLMQAQGGGVIRKNQEEAVEWMRMADRKQAEDRMEIKRRQLAEREFMLMRDLQLRNEPQGRDGQ